MGVRNYLIDGGSGTGKTAVCDELLRRGFHAIHGDRELAYRGDPETGEPVDGAGMGPRELSRHHLWRVDMVEEIVARRDEEVTFFCGGSRNSSRFSHLLDGVFILELDDLDVLARRIDERVRVDPDDWGGRPAERELIMELQQTKEGIAAGGIAIDASQPLGRVVDEILRRTHQP